LNPVISWADMLAILPTALPVVNHDNTADADPHRVGDVPLVAAG